MKKNKFFLFLIFLLPQKTLCMETKNNALSIVIPYTHKKSICRRDTTPTQVQKYKNATKEQPNYTYKKTAETPHDETRYKTKIIAINTTPNKPSHCYDFLCFCICHICICHKR